MASIEDFRGFFASINSGLENLAADIDRLSNQIPPTGGLTEAEAEEVRVSLAGLADRVATLAAVTPEP